MENGDASSSSSSSSAAAAASSSYTYWVRKELKDAAPLPAPRKLTPQDHNSLSSSHLGSAWNRAGTWEEKDLNGWATHKIKELLGSTTLEFSGGRAEIVEVSKCSGDAFLVTVRNKKRVGYTYELTIIVKGEWVIGDEKKKVKGHLDVPEFTFGELDDLQIEVRLDAEKDLMPEDKTRIRKDLKMFLQPIQEKLFEFEQQLKDSGLA
ncbi:uncharacterized protein LOC141699800 isoform X2 [Apium graveolens]|uniref:uncharacterized protein LOC141699800 isoform X2 n=2 Tax=Apium graveolens TaxID=4045 RepID=UPI003D7A5491